MTASLRPVPLVLLLAGPLATPGDDPPAERGCVACHEKRQPGIVSDWRLSRHGKVRVACEACHGADHRGTDDVAAARLPSPDTCQRCHPQQVAQFRRGKHARAWTAVKAFPTFHDLDGSGMAGPAACVTCHRIGLKEPEETAALLPDRARHGGASCDACHTRHRFSTEEARQPAACRTCHGRLQFDPWRTTTHGLRSQVRSDGATPSGAATATCQACHMAGGDHGVRAPWGNLALRVPDPPLDDWGRDRATLLVALGVLTEAGGQGPRYDQAEDAALVGLDRIRYQNDRLKLATACRQCHVAPLVREELDRLDGLVREADALCAKAVEEVVGLYADGLLARQGPGPWPDLVRSATGAPVERRLAHMFFDHRARLVAAAFHMSPDAETWRAALGRDLAEIQALAHPRRPARPPGATGRSDRPAGGPAP